MVRRCPDWMPGGGGGAPAALDPVEGLLVVVEIESQFDLQSTGIVQKHLMQ